MLARYARCIRATIASTQSRAASSGDTNQLRLSDACVDKLRKTATGGQALRVSVEGGGCSGFQYNFTLDAQAPRPDDTLIERDGARVLVDAASLELLRGATVDYHEELIRSSFRIVQNPQAEKGCSCGASFAIKL
ncbi:iron-sulfur cluster assembly 2 homolog, mitochondrial [Ixodes scapularis]